MKVFLIRTPRYYWPFINEYDNFLLPQSLVCLASVARDAGFDVKIFDCMPQKIGWRSLRKIIEDEKPDVVCAGDSESMYSSEVEKLFIMTKEINKNIITISGGAHFSNLIEQSLENLPIDFIVRGEGEISFVNLLKELQKEKPQFENVSGIGFKKEDKIIITQPQRLISDLDSLPHPAYDLVPISEYGKGKYLFDPGGTTLHHSRGCTSSCKFCVWWVQMAEEEIIDGKKILHPRWRTKSVEKTISEIEILYYKYNRRGFVFVDDSWNIDALWNEKFADEVLKRKLKFNWFAFMRVDCILRDEKNGIFEKLVRAGLKHISVGVERKNADELGKNFYKENLVKECFSIIAKKYPEIFRQATFIVGIREETKETLLAQANYAKELKVDFPAFHPLTPIPGTELYKEYKEKGYIEITDYSYYDWLTPVMSSKYLKREEIENLMFVLNKKFTSFWWLIRGLFSKYSYKRKMYIWWLLVFLRVSFASLKRFVNPFSWKTYSRLVKPKWYDE